MKKTSISKLPSKDSRGKIAPKASKASTKSAAEVPQGPAEFSLPALSVPFKPKVTDANLEKLKKKTIRRNVPPGEDLKCLKTILKTIQGQNVTVQEFIALVAPSTGDCAAVLTQVMNDDLTTFRRLARKVYETITQDNSDVLLNQQLQLAEFYKEKKHLLNEKMMRTIDDIYDLVPNFDFDRYHKEKDKYLDEVLPMPEELKFEPEEMEMLKRQAAYHRLQWLRSEGERLNEENNSLKERLEQMKQLHKEEQEKMADMERMAEAKNEVLEAKKEEKRQTLDKLNQSLEKSLITQEKKMRTEKDQEALTAKIEASQGAVKKKSKTLVKKKRRPKWNEVAAQEIESRAMAESQRANSARATSPFHFSPIKSPEAKAAKPPSPFHYSPPHSPQATPRASGTGYGASRQTWSGFY